MSLLLESAQEPWLKNFPGLLKHEDEAMVCTLFAESLPICFFGCSQPLFFLIECAGGFVQMRCEILRLIGKFASFVHVCFFFLYTRTVILCIFLGA